MASTVAILILFFMVAIIGTVGWFTCTYMAQGHGEIERSVLGDETYRQEYDN